MLSQAQAPFHFLRFPPSSQKCPRNDNDKLNTLHVFEACPPAPFSSLQYTSSELLGLSPFKAHRAFANTPYVNGKFMHTHPCMCSHPFCLLTYSCSLEKAVRHLSFSSQGLSFQLQTLLNKFWGLINLSVKARSNKAQVELGTSLVLFL